MFSLAEVNFSTHDTLSTPPSNPFLWELSNPAEIKPAHYPVSAHPCTSFQDVHKHILGRCHMLVFSMVTALYVHRRGPEQAPWSSPSNCEGTTESGTLPHLSRPCRSSSCVRSLACSHEKGRVKFFKCSLKKYTRIWPSSLTASVNKPKPNIYY